MAIITKNCLANDKLREISMTKKYTVPASNMSDPLKIENGFLKTMDNYKVLKGGKTGSWSENQCTIALEFSDEGINAVIVLLGDTLKGRARDPRTIVGFAHDVTPGFIVTDSNKGVCEAWVKGGSEVKVPLDIKGLRYAYPSNGKASGIRIKTEIDRLEAPLKKGDRAGTFYVYANDQEVGKGRLYVGEDIEKGWFPSAIYISDRKSLAVILAAVLILLLGFVLEKNKRPVRPEHRAKH